MSSIKHEIINSIIKIQEESTGNKLLTRDEMEMFFLNSLIEEECNNHEKR